MRYVYLAPGILVLSLVGAYAATLDMGTVWMCIFFGVLGWLMIRFEIPRPPLVLALVLAQLVEMSIRQALLLSFGSLDIFIQRPISLALLLVIGVMLALTVANTIKRRKALQQ